MDQNQLREKTNLTTTTVGGIVITGAVLCALIDMGFTGMMFSAIAGTGTYLVYNMVMDDIPQSLRDKYNNQEIVGWETVQYQLAAACAAGAAIINPLIGIPLVCLALVFHFWLVWQRERELYPYYMELARLQEMYGPCPVQKPSQKEPEGISPEAMPAAQPMTAAPQI